MRRSAGVYVAVLGCSMAVTVIGLASILSVRVERRSTEQAGDFLEARLLAQSAVEIALCSMESDPDWRDTSANGTWRSNQSLGSGSYTLTVTDGSCVGVGDGSLGDDRSEHVAVTGTGVVGSAHYKLCTEMAPVGPPGMDSLGSAIHVATSIVNNSTISIDAPLTSNGSVNNVATINGDVEAVGTITNSGTITGSTETGVNAREMPDSSVFDSYINEAAEITTALVPLSGGTRMLQRVLISPASNPFGGALNARGLYKIACNGAVIRITDVRVHGTLIILDPGTGSDITGAVNWERFDSTLPALMVRGNFAFNWTGTLSENSGSNVNFNPIGTPYDGVSDSDTSDSYPSFIKGLIYVSGMLSTSQSQSITGVLLVGGTSLTVGGALNVMYDPNLINAPPPGFERTHWPVAPIAGSWVRVVN